MKLNHDCIRKTLLYLEETLDCYNSLDLSDFATNGFSKEDTLYSISKLKEAGFISASIGEDIIDGISITVHEITWEGHKFLDTIRDNRVWSETKNILSKVSSCSISFISTIASQVLTNLISQYVGNPNQPTA
ncbi:MAG: DUF2513 domain-containing protein [Clostridia bacterium]|nr:DUF2513 domain-containing protein [Clostridia bacterium]